ncbi:MAG: hypothetical protein K6L60_12825 [Oceanobacter sp.]
MLDKNIVTQENINADKVVGRDDNSVNHNHFYNRPVIYREDLILKRLLEEHENERLNNSSYQKFSDELNNFFKEKQLSKLRNLETKLMDGGRENFINIAIESKERVTKKIHKYSLYKSAQDIYTYLLTNIRSAFKHGIESRIKSGKFDTYEIDELVKNEIIDPFFHNIQGSSLYIDLDELYGLLYLLTGNCHIEWD